MPTGPGPGAERPSASVIVLAYNSAATLATCLESVLPQAEELGAELLLVDNASRDDSRRIAEDRGVRVVESSQNLGFAAGCNLGVTASHGRTVVLVNPDTELDDGALRALVEATHDPAWGPVGGRARRRDGSFDPRCTMGRPSLRGALCFAVGLDRFARGSRWFDPEHGRVDVPTDGPPVVADAVSGAVLAMERTLWEALGGLDEGFFVYGEDVDLCLRAWRRGHDTVVVPQAGYHHVGGMRSDGTITRRILLYRGKVELYRRHLAEPASTVAVACLQVGALLRGLPANGPLEGARSRARPWWDLFRQRRSWRGGHQGARASLEVAQ